MSNDDQVARERDLAQRVRTALVRSTATPPADAPDHIKELWPRMLAGDAEAKATLQAWLRSGDRRTPISNLSRFGRNTPDDGNKR